eukprot:5662793-Pyramimonas_sp.AAC.1
MAVVSVSIRITVWTYQSHRRTHGTVKLSQALTKCNQCIACREIFWDKKTAQKHLHGSILHGRCLSGKASTICALAPPGDLSCRVCGSSFLTLDEYCVHACTHLPVLPE